jgi:hypothetical protein
MPGTRTAPTVDGTPPFQNVSYQFIDSTEDIRSVSIQFPPGTTSAQIEAIAVALQARSNASLFNIEVKASYTSAPDVGNALAEVHISVYDNVVVLFKDQVNHSQDIFILAPITDLQPTDSDTPVASQLIAIILAVTTALEQGTTDDWQAISARFTERREKNQRTFI